MTPNQRLMVAVALSIIFFVAYTAIFPSEPLEEANTIPQEVGIKQDTVQQTIETATGHAVNNNEIAVASTSNDILTVSNDEFILKMDTLGRISSMELLREKYNDQDDNHAQLISKNGTKPLFVRFLDNDLNKEATQVPYSASASNIELDSKAQKVVLTQKLSTLTVTKEVTFYPDGHYDIDVNLSEDKRHFIYLGQRPEVVEQMMTIAGAMVYTDDEIVTIIEDGDAQERKSFTSVELISAFDQYTASIMYGFAKDTNVIIERDREDNPVVYFDALQNMSFNG